MATATNLRATSVSPPETFAGMAISLIFWLSLLVSAILFAVVSLSPKLETYLHLRDQFETNQRKLVDLELQAEQLRQVIDAIQTDTDFASELIRIEFDAVRPGEEVIPVDSALKLDARDSKSNFRNDADSIRPYEALVIRLASDSELRTLLLGSAILLVIFSFTLLQPPRAEVASSRDPHQPSFWKTLRQRYAR